VKSWFSHAIAFFSFAAAIPAYSQVPQWAVSHKNAAYPAAEYILGVGKAMGEKAGETAKRLAQLDIALQVRMKVKLEIKSIQQTYELNPNQESYADFKIRSTSVVDEELTEPVIVETEVDTLTNTAYALAALQKGKCSATIAAELTEGWKHAKDLQRTAQDLLRQGKIAEAIQTLIVARACVMELLPKLALHNVLAGAPFPDEPSLGPSAFASSVRDVLSEIRIEKRGGDKQKGKTGEDFPEPFIVQVTANGGENSVPVVGAAIEFLNSSGEKCGEAITDAKGIASCSMKARGNIGPRLRAGLSLPRLGKEFSSALNSSSAVFNCVLLDADAAFSIKIDVRSSKVSDALRSAVVDAVKHAGYHVVDMSRFMLRVGFQSAAPTTVEGAEGALYNVSSDITLVLIDKDSNRTLGSIVGKSQGIAKTEDGALEQSARGAKFDGPDLTALLEKARD
jgi:hypothetical protein